MGCAWELLDYLIQEGLLRWLATTRRGCATSAAVLALALGAAAILLGRLPEHPGWLLLGGLAIVLAIAIVLIPERRA